MQLALFSIAVGVVSGFAGGGRFANVGWRRIRLTWLPAGWLAGMASSVFLSGQPAFALGLAGMACLAVFAIVNTKDLSCMWLVAFGLCLNFGVTANNHGMPYSPLALAAAGVRPGSYNDVPKSSALSHPEHDDDQLLFLSDVIPVAPLRTVVSFGDLLVAFGLGAVTATAMWDRRPRRLRKPRHLSRVSADTQGGRGVVAETPTETPAALTAMSGSDGSESAPGDMLPGDMHPVGTNGFSSRILLLEATGDPSVLIDLRDFSADLADATASHVVAAAFRRHALDDHFVARANAMDSGLPSSTNLPNDDPTEASEA